MLNQTIQNSISYPPIGGFLIFYSYNLIFNMNVKMQNKAKFKFAKIPLKFCIQRTNKNALRPPQPKNKPKQTQITPFPYPVMSFRESAESSIKNYPPTGRFRNFDIYILIFNMLFMTNEPNFLNCKITLSDFHNKTNDYSPATNDHKNEPKQTQFRPSHASLPP